jgi:hypothetical protein
VPQTGESCGTSNYSSCDSALKDLKRMRWDCLKIDKYRSQWSGGGCLNRILLSFGYRIVLKSAIFPDSVCPGCPLLGSIKIINRGFGKMFNYRGCELVLKSSANGSIIKSDLGIDPRRWCTDSVVTVPVRALIPADAASGQYRVYLNLPDTASRLKTRKEYSVRLANVNTWDDATGYNSLNYTVVISPNVPRVGVLQPEPVLRPGSFTIAKRNGSAEICFSAPLPKGCTFSAFTLSGSKVWSRTVRAGTKRVTWTGGAPGVYLLKIVLGDEQSAGSSALELHTRLFTMQ